MARTLLWGPTMSTRTPLRILVALACVASSAAFANAAPKLELEAGAGVSDLNIVAPFISVRGGVDFWDFLTVSLRGEGAFAKEASSPQLVGGAYQGWAALPELRLHLPTRYVQPFIEGGVGIGQLVSSNISSDVYEYTPQHGRIGAFWQVGLGARALAGPVTISLEGLVMVYSRVSGGNGTFLKQPTAAEEAAEYPLAAVGLLLSVGFRSPL